jgi:hypothetical protein
MKTYLEVFTKALYGVYDTDEHLGFENAVILDFLDNAYGVSDYPLAYGDLETARKHMLDDDEDIAKFDRRIENGIGAFMDSMPFAALNEHNYQTYDDILDMQKSLLCGEEIWDRFPENASEKYKRAINDTLGIFVNMERNEYNIIAFAVAYYALSPYTETREVMLQLLLVNNLVDNEYWPAWFHKDNKERFRDALADALANSNVDKLYTLVKEEQKRIHDEYVKTYSFFGDIKD